MKNVDIRDRIRRSGLYQYEVAGALGITETKFSRQIARGELSDEDKDKIREAILNLVLQREEGFNEQKQNGGD